MTYREIVLIVGWLILQTAPPCLASEAGEQLGRYMLELTAESHRQGPLLLSDCGTEVFSATFCDALNLAERGEFAEAASALSPWITDPAAANSEGMLRSRVEILNRWSDMGGIDLDGYREFYLAAEPAALSESVQPVVKLWQTHGLPQADKYFLIADLLEQRKDPRGQTLALLAIPELPDADAAAAGGALLQAGNVYHQHGDFSNAEQAWRRVKEHAQRTPTWSKAVFNLGVLEEERENFHVAIEYFSEVLSSNPNDEEPGASLMETNRNYSHHSTLAISRCYEALGDYAQALQYAKLARDQYKFVSWCGNCLQSAQRSVGMRIAALWARAYGLKGAAAGLGLFVVTGLFYQKRRRRLM